MSFANIFKKHKTTTELILSDYMKVIESYEIENMDEPDFNNGRRRTESEYQLYLERLQPLINKCQNSNDMESVAKEYGKSDKVVKAVLNSVIGTEEIVVEKSLNGKYRILEGMHRAYVAKKCGYKLLVRVKQEEVKKSG